MLVGCPFTKCNTNGIATTKAFIQGVNCAHGPAGDFSIGIRPDDEDWAIEIARCDLIFQVTEASSYKGPEDFGWKVRSICQERNIPRLIADVGFFHNKRLNEKDLDRYVSIGLGNGVKTELNYFNQNSPADRWEKLGIELKHWRTAGYILILGQNYRGLSVDGFNYESWITGLIKQLRFWGYKPILRPHPAQSSWPSGIEISKGTLEEDLAGARLTISYSTNSAIDGLIQGIPALVANPKSFLYKGYNKINIENIEQPPIIEDREQIFHDLAYAQWHLNELRNGTFWRRFREKINL